MTTCSLCKQVLNFKRQACLFYSIAPGLIWYYNYTYGKEKIFCRINNWIEMHKQLNYSTSANEAIECTLAPYTPQQHWYMHAGIVQVWKLSHHKVQVVICYKSSAKFRWLFPVTRSGPGTCLTVCDCFRAGVSIPRLALHVGESDIPCNLFWCKVH